MTSLNVQGNLVKQVRWDWDGFKGFPPGVERYTRAMNVPAQFITDAEKNNFDFGFKQVGWGIGSFIQKPMS